MLKDGARLIRIHSEHHADELAAGLHGDMPWMAPATEMVWHAMPWLGHIMVSRSETARTLLTPGAVMQLPPEDEIVMVAGIPPIRARKARYYVDPRFRERVLSAPDPREIVRSPRPDDWTGLKPLKPNGAGQGADISAAPNTSRGLAGTSSSGDSDDAGLRREPGLEPYQDIAPQPVTLTENEFDPDFDASEGQAVRNRGLVRDMRRVARQISMNQDDGLEL